MEQPRDKETEDQTQHETRMAIRNEIYDTIEMAERSLNRKAPTPEEDIVQKQQLVEFLKSPYAWVEMKTSADLAQKKVVRSHEADTERKKQLLAEIKKDERILYTLKEAYKRNIRLRVRRSFTPTEIILPGGDIINTDTLKKEIDSITGKHPTYYRIDRCAQERNTDLLILQTDTGERYPVALERLRALRDASLNAKKDEKQESSAQPEPKKVEQSPETIEACIEKLEDEKKKLLAIRERIQVQQKELTELVAIDPEKDY
jgi:hypothetical protein